MNLSGIFKKGADLVEQNATAILTGVGVIGTIATAVLTGRATIKAARLIEDAEVHKLIHEPKDKDGEPALGNLEKAFLTWPLFLPAVGAGAVTVTSIIYANRISSKRAAALAAAYGLSEKAFSEYKEKALQHLGIKKEEALVDEIAQDKVNLNPPMQTIIVGDGEVLCYDAPSGRYFKGNVEKIRAAENKVNYEIIHQHAASLSSFYEEIGLPPTSYSDDVGWNMDNLIGLTMSSVLTDENKPCLVIDFKVAPVTGYGRVY